MYRQHSSLTTKHKSELKSLSSIILTEEKKQNCRTLLQISHDRRLFGCDHVGLQHEQKSQPKSMVFLLNLRKACGSSSRMAHVFLTGIRIPACFFQSTEAHV